MISYRSHDVCSKQSVGLFVTQNLDEAVCVVVGLGSAVGGEGEFAYRIFDAWKTETLRENFEPKISGILYSLPSDLRSSSDFPTHATSG